MAKVTLEDRIVSIIEVTLSISKEKIVREASFIKDLRSDELDIIEIVLEIEDDFDISLPDEEVEKIVMVGQLIDLVKNKVDNS